MIFVIVACTFGDMNERIKRDKTGKWNEKREKNKYEKDELNGWGKTQEHQNELPK